MKTLVLTIEGMHYDGCAETIKALLTLETGVKVASVSYQERRARVLYDPAVIEERKLVAAIAKCGFKAASTA
jgi:copper chaperone CopZ